jgi:CheY-like chemotaxis protein
MDSTQLRILLAEDESSLRDMIALVLSDEGYQVDDVADGNEAFNLLKQHKYDLLVTDLYMPVMNGFELIMACKESFPETKIIL